MMKAVKMMGAAVALAFGVVAGPGQANEMLQKAIEDNIRPVGSVAVAGESSAGAAAAAAAGPRSGADVYNGACMACHATGAAGAPKVGDKAAWEPRFKQGEDTLLKHAINGIRAMPPRGTCADCSDDELKGAIEHMLKETGLM